MKFDIGNIDSYDGADLIFLIGVPGSRWSNAHRCISSHPMVNNTDWSDVKSWQTTSLDVYGKEIKVGSHMGSYWGPGNYYGDKFDRIDELTKEYIVKEFMEAYEHWDGIKIIKSHWFAYNIAYLHQLFPAAKIVSCYANDIDSFYWWHKCGGWGLGYANYSWYENDVRLLEKIKEENSNILKFNIDRDVNFEYVSTSVLWNKLEFSPVSKLNYDPKIPCKIAVYSGKYLHNFDHITGK